MVAAGPRRPARKVRPGGVCLERSPDRLSRGLRAPRPYLEELVGAAEEGVPIVSVLDGHSHALAYLGAALGVPQLPLRVGDFGPSRARAGLHRPYRIDAAPLARAARTLLGRSA